MPNRRPIIARATDLVEVDDGDEAMRVDVTIETVVDGRQVDHQQVPVALSSVQVADRPELDERRAGVQVEGPPSVRLSQWSDVDSDV